MIGYFATRIMDQVQTAYVSELFNGVPYRVGDLHIDLREGSLTLWGRVEPRLHGVALSDVIELHSDSDSHEVLFQGCLIEVDSAGNFIAQSVPGHSSLLCLVEGSVTKTYLYEF